MGMTKGGSGRQITANPDPELSAFTKEVREQSAPVREQLFSQLNEALATGGIGARIPIINRSVEASNAATSEALRSFEQETAATDPMFAKSPFYARLREDIRAGGLARSADIGPAIARAFIEQAPNVALGTGNTIVTGLSNAANIGTQQAIAGKSLQTQRQIAAGNQIASIFSSLLESGGKMGAAAAPFMFT